MSFRNIRRWTWRAGRGLVISLRSAHNFLGIQNTPAPAPVRVALLALGWLPRWALTAYSEIGKNLPDQALQEPGLIGTGSFIFMSHREGISIPTNRALERLSNVHAGKPIIVQQGVTFHIYAYFEGAWQVRSLRSDAFTPPALNTTALFPVLADNDHNTISVSIVHNNDDCITAAMRAAIEEHHTLPTSMTFFSGAAMVLAGVAVVPGYYYFFDVVKTLLDPIPGFGVAAAIVAGITTIVYIAMKFEEYSKALTPADSDTETIAQTNKPIYTRVWDWTCRTFSYNHFFHIKESDTWDQQLGKVGGTVLAGAAATTFAFGAVSSLPVALPIAIAGCAAYGLGEFFQSKSTVAEFYGRLKHSAEWLFGQTDESVDSARWNNLPGWQRGIFYTLALGITASIAIPVALGSTPILPFAIPIAIGFTAFFYPIFLKVFFKGCFKDPVPEEEEPTAETSTTLSPRLLPTARGQELDTAAPPRAYTPGLSSIMPNPNAPPVPTDAPANDSVATAWSSACSVS